jgi:hypothetical protein
MKILVKDIFSFGIRKELSSELVPTFFYSAKNRPIKEYIISTQKKLLASLRFVISAVAVKKPQT